jgi:hypothetical protein
MACTLLFDFLRPNPLPEDGGEFLEEIGSEAGVAADEVEDEDAAGEEEGGDAAEEGWGEESWRGMVMVIVTVS